VSFVEVDVSVSGSLDRLERALAGLDGPDVQRVARRAARKATRPVVEALKAAILATPGAAPDGDLRPSIAAAISSSATASGVRIKVNGGRLGGRRKLPGYIDDGHWRHPVYGNRRNWVSQRGEPWFGVTFNRYRAPIRRAVLDDVTDAVRAELGI